jgi:CDP-diacylglycerol--glycerol-3-phosphate 3-phosphatidyltransferase
MPTSADSAQRAVGAVTENFWNLPNAITLLRIGLTPLLLLLPWFEGPAWSAIIGFGFLAISLTDLLDGYLARLHGTESRIGKLLDPLADKFLVMTAFVMLVAVGRIPSWALPLVIAILGREFGVTALRAMMSAEGVVIATGLTVWSGYEYFAAYLAGRARP